MNTNFPAEHIDPHLALQLSLPTHHTHMHTHPHAGAIPTPRKDILLVLRNHPRPLSLSPSPCLKSSTNASWLYFSSSLHWSLKQRQGTHQFCTMVHFSPPQPPAQPRLTESFSTTGPPSLSPEPSAQRADMLSQSVTIE
jgi:hypothetical protein